MSTDLPLPEMPELPELELDETAMRQPSSPPGPRFSVRIGPVLDPVESAPALAEILKVDLPAAQRMAMNAPGVLLAGVSCDEAKRVASEVQAIGLRATVEGDSVEAALPLSTRPPSLHPSSHPPAALDRHVSAAPPPVETPGGGPGDGFWMQTPVAFVAPLLGRGGLLLVASGLTGVGVGLMAIVPGLLLKLGFLVGLQLVAFGLFVEIFNRLAQAAIYRADDAWLPEPISELPNAATLFWRGVVNVLVFALLAAPALLVAFYTRSAVVALLAQIILFLYWPMALTVQSVSGRLAGPLDVVAVAKGIIAAPIEYLSVCVLTFAAIAGSTALVLVFSGAGVVALGASGGGLGGGALLYMSIAFAWYAAIGYFHGVLGYLMGALVRSKSEAFEFLQDD